MQNWGSDPNATNQNVPTTYSYDGLNHILTSSAAVILPANVTYQPKTKSASTTPPPAKTTYIYGDAASVTGSKDLLREIDYPDGTKERYFYDALGELVAKTDRTGVQHKYSYDSLGNLIDDSVTNWGPPSSNIDETVAELSTAYDTLGRACLLTSYGPSGNVVNQVENVYDGLGNLVTQYQSHSGPVYTPSTETVAHPVSPAVQYVYKTSPEGNRNYCRLIGVTYPEGTDISYAYFGLDDSISRITSVNVGGTALEAYQYLGLSTITSRTRPNGIPSLSVAVNTFGQVFSMSWTATTTIAGQPLTSTTPSNSFTYSYNADGMVTSVTDGTPAAGGNVTYVTTSYTYDKLNNRTSDSRGSVSVVLPGSPASTSTSRCNRRVGVSIRWETATRATPTPTRSVCTPLFTRGALRKETWRASTKHLRATHPAWCTTPGTGWSV